jgi:hypothetical protein
MTATLTVHHDAPGEVLHAEVRHPAIAPDPVRHRVVDEDLEADDEVERAGPGDALGPGAGHEQRRDAGEHHLEQGEQRLRDGRGDGVALVLADAQHEHVVEGADVLAAAAPEGQRVAEERPHHAEHRHADEDERDDGQRVLAAQHAGLEEGQARHHGQHQHEADHHPGGVGAVDAAGGGGGSDNNISGGHGVAVVVLVVLGLSGYWMMDY